ncbi:hypothetical protein Trco_006010 [Trichoderma cornu-damae]|uniref:Uncharacterized protein n=1 Tax=Trichoderma cornu-damae TaxID=654480 RepID=A0A9P8QQP2_9HYPO|nr:hypothetical protein Trco_006010 [Trichoderma cornu-damae]
MSFIIPRRDPALADVSDEALWQLTKLLYMDAADYFGDHTGEWLAKQEEKVKELDATLLRPKDLIGRFAISMSKRRLPFCQEGARLCAAHKALDPRVIRNMLRLVAEECTIQTNRYRSLRLKEMLSPSLQGWMGRMDFLTVLWLGEERFRRTFQGDLGGYLPDCVRTSKCEACMLAFVGGSALYLTDLRASVLARQAYREKLTGKASRNPRLLRIVDSWISLYQADCQQVVYGCSESIVDDIVEMRTLARRTRDKENETRRKRGELPRPHCNSRVMLTEDGLPIPRQPRLRDSDKARLSRRTERRRAARADKASSSVQEKTEKRPEQQQQQQQQQQEEEEEEERRHTMDAHFQDILEALGGPIETKSEDALAQENDDAAAVAAATATTATAAAAASTTKAAAEPKAEENGKTGHWDEWPSDEDANEKEDGEEEYWVRDYRKWILEGGDDREGGIAGRPSETLGMRSRLSFGINTRVATGIAATSSWTSKVDETDDDDDDDDSSGAESPNTIDVPILFRDTRLSPPRAASSVYSCDGGAPPRPNPFDRTMSVISRFTRESAVPAPLRIARAGEDAGGRTEEKKKSVSRMAALAIKITIAIAIAIAIAIVIVIVIVIAIVIAIAIAIAIAIV